MTDQPDPTRCGAQHPDYDTIACDREASHPGQHWDRTSGAAWTDANTRWLADDDDEPNSERPTPPAAPTTGDPYDIDPGMTADQEIRARALTLAIDAIARIPSHADYQPLPQAGQFAEWIRSGWPRADGNDGDRP